MNTLLIALLLAVAPATDAATESTTTLEQLGLHRGMDYVPVRSALLRDGWTVEPHDYEGAPPFAAFPEVDCGQGWQAVCSAASAGATRLSIWPWIPPTTVTCCCWGVSEGPARVLVVGAVRLDATVTGRQSAR